MLINNNVYKIIKIEGNHLQFVSLVCKELGYIHGYLIKATKLDEQRANVPNLEVVYDFRRLTSGCTKIIHSSPECFVLHSASMFQTVQYIMCSLNEEQVSNNLRRLKLVSIVRMEFLPGCGERNRSNVFS
jgi:hypothetical protein